MRLRTCSLKMVDYEKKLIFEPLQAPVQFLTLTSTTVVQREPTQVFLNLNRFSCSNFYLDLEIC